MRAVRHSDSGTEREVVGGKREGKPITLAALAVWPARAESKPVTKPIPMSGTYSFSYTHSHTHHPSIHHMVMVAVVQVGSLRHRCRSLQYIVVVVSMEREHYLHVTERDRVCFWRAWFTKPALLAAGKLQGACRAISMWWPQ